MIAKVLVGGKDRAMSIIFGLVFLAGGALGVGSFFGTLLDNHAIAAFSGAVWIVIIVGTASYNFSKTGKPLIIYK